jgi:hypothetical protein
MKFDSSFMFNGGFSILGHSICMIGQTLQDFEGAKEFGLKFTSVSHTSGFMM